MVFSVRIQSKGIKTSDHENKIDLNNFQKIVNLDNNLFNYLSD